jgi:hypothetical protein
LTAREPWKLKPGSEVVFLTAIGRADLKRVPDGASWASTWGYRISDAEFAEM